MQSVMNQQNRPIQKQNTKVQLLRKIREYDFAIVETALFLNTHPKNHKALNYYHKLKVEREKVVSEFEKNFGPITMCGNENKNKWDWISSPWPWEGEC